MTHIHTHPPLLHKQLCCQLNTPTFCSSDAEHTNYHEEFHGAHGQCMYFLPSLVCLQLASKRERWLDVSDWSKKSTTYPIGSNHRKNSYRQIHLFLKVTITCVTHTFSCGCCLQLYKSVELLIPLVSFRTLIHSTGCEIYLVGKSYFFISLLTAVASQHSCGGGLSLACGLAVLYCNSRQVMTGRKPDGRGMRSFSVWGSTNPGLASQRVTTWRDCSLASSSSVMILCE